MSGGSYNYLCYQIEEEYVGRMYDPELNDMMEDLAELLHDLEWWQSGDIGKDSYAETVRKFKRKWFDADRSERLEKIVTQECDKLKQDLLDMI